MAILRLRRRRLSRNSEEETNAIGASDAWWSERDHVERVPKPKKRGRDAVKTEPESDEAPGSDHQFNAMPEPESDAAAATPPNPLNWAFEVLELEPGCPWEEVRARHNALAKSHHPDMVARLFPEAATAAAEEMAQINRAYGELKRIYRSRSAPRRPADKSGK